MSDRIWTPGQRNWGVVEDIQPSSNKAYVTEDGRTFQDSELTVSVEAAAEMHAGYRCARCLEPLQELGAFPERCPVCGFEVAKYQRQALEAQYKGVDPTVVGSFPLDREMEVLEREKHKPKPMMSVPRKIK